VVVPDFTICKSATGVMVVIAVLVLFPGVGSVIPGGVDTVATLVIVPLVPAVPVRVKVTLPPLGRVGIAKVPDCKAAKVELTGQAAPPVGEPQVTPVAVKLATAGSPTVAPLAADGPLLVTTKV
jgi:hypothetical protein